MNPPELLEALLELADDVGLEVRVVPAADDAVTSGVCRVRDRVWVLLSPRDPVPEQIAVLGGALRDHASGDCEERYLPPAVRNAIGL